MKTASDPTPCPVGPPNALRDVQPWQTSFPAEPDTWELFRSYASFGTADAIAGILRSLEVPAYVDSRGRLWPTGCLHHVFVEARLAHRARWLLEEDAFSDTELSYLATGGFPGPDAD